MQLSTYIVYSLPKVFSPTFLQMSYVLFHEAGLMETFRVPQREFINYFRALEANYGSNVCECMHTHTHTIPLMCVIVMVRNAFMRMPLFNQAGCCKCHVPLASCPEGIHS